VSSVSPSERPLRPTLTFPATSELYVEERKAASAHTQAQASKTERRRRRGWLMRRLLVVADLAGLAVAFMGTELLLGGLFVGGSSGPDAVPLGTEISLFIVTLPVWIVGAKVFGLYDRDEERAAHSTPDDVIRMFLLMTVGVFLATHVAALTHSADPDLTKLTIFWALSIVFVTAARIVARTVARRSDAYVQNTVIIGAGEIGQLVARKLLHHSEFGINLVGFVDSLPKERGSHLEELTILGGLDDLPDIVSEHNVERVIFAFSNDSHVDLLPLVRFLRDTGVQVDIVPRLFEVIGPRTDVHSIEGVSLVGLPPVRPSRTSRIAKRACDLVGAFFVLALALPVLFVIALMIKRDSPGPVFFRQKRLGKDMQEFSLLKFRTMKVDVDDHVHRDFIAATMNADSAPATNGLYKLDRGDDVTRLGRWLRRTSLDELPQLVNVIRGEMSLVGPRPCLAYETESFKPHHFDRFLVPPGLTGLWQTSARAHATFGEALDLDVLYAQSWTLGLDLLLLARTPLQLFRSGSTA
jgi:exopolysaccharide biosynthesis polyprenyl glycosylphosphotransferase